MKVEMQGYNIVEYVEHEGKDYARVVDSELGLQWYPWLDFSCNDYSTTLDFEEEDKLEEVYQASKQGYNFSLIYPIPFHL